MGADRRGVERAVPFDRPPRPRRIVEYFGTSAAALMREQELEDLLMAARGAHT